jgi:hypothetical protein
MGMSDAPRQYAKRTLGYLGCYTGQWAERLPAVSRQLAAVRVSRVAILT